MQQRISFNSRDKLIQLDTQKIVYFEGMSRFLALLLVCFIATSISYAQDFKITTFEKYPLDLTAAVANIKDKNGDVCALIKFFTRDEEFVFEPNLGIVKTEKNYAKKNLF